MSIDPDTFRAEFKWDLEAHDKTRPRALQSDDGKLGVSEIGWCREAARRTLLQVPKTDSPNQWAAMVGTYVDAGVEEARAAAHPTFLMKPKVDVALPLPDGRTVIVPGTGDEADPNEPSYTDVKTRDGLALARRQWGDGQRERWQRHLIYAGLIADHGFPEQGTVRNIVLDRSGGDGDHFVYQEPYDPTVIREAGEWMGDVVYAIDNHEEAPKDVAGHLCASCSWFTDCRGTDVTIGRITNPRLIAAVNEYGAARARKREAEQVIAELRDEVINVSGFTDEYQLHTSKINANNGSQRITTKAVA